MPTYNFTTGGDIYMYTNVIRSIDGPAALTPRADANTFMLSYLGGSDLFYYTGNTYKIDGTTFEGTLTEFCDAAQALFTTAGGGGGASWADITESVSVEISATKALTINDADGNGLVYASSGTTMKAAGLGDVAGLIEEGPSSSVYCNHDTNTNSSVASLDANFDAYSSDAYVSVAATNADQAVVNIGVDTASFSGQFKVDSTGYSFSGIVEYADNAAAITGGLVAGNIYRTGDALKIVH